ncbi:MAG TPA: adenylate cyclase regulatory domain-containing protein, partial [Thermoanaerobaculia bacterium]
APWRSRRRSLHGGARGVSAEEPSFNEVARRVGVQPSTLRRWASQGLIPLDDGRWTPPAVAHARLVARMRERGHSVEEIRQASASGRLAFGYLEDLFPGDGQDLSLEEAAEASGLEPALIERILASLGLASGGTTHIKQDDQRMLQYISAILAAGFPLVAFLQLVRVYGQALAQIADAEVRLFHLYVHEPLIRDGVPELEMAEEMEQLAADLLPLALPLFEYMHNRYLRYFIEQDVVGHMESELGSDASSLGRVPITLCFIDLTGFTRYTEEEGDLEALDVIENFVETVEGTLPPEATIVKTIGDEVMVVSPDPVTLTEWAVGLLALFQARPQPRVGIHYGEAVYRDGDYFGGDVNLAHRVVSRALGGEVLVTQATVDAIKESDFLRFDPIGEVVLKGFPEPISLYIARPAME